MTRLRMGGKCRNQEPQVSFFTFLESSQMTRLFYHSVNTQFKLLHLLKDIDFTCANKQNMLFLCFIL